MSDPAAPIVYRATRRGLPVRECHLVGEEGPLGVLTLERGRGMVVAGRWSPEKGEVLTMRRDPGLLRSQFSLWTDGREWLGSSLRADFVQREIRLHTGSRPLRMLPLTGFRAGWVLQAPKTGDMARIHLGLLGGEDRIEIARKVDQELLIFAYFLGQQLRLESFWPGPIDASERSAARLAG
jgi:hypothetical protein